MNTEPEKFDRFLVMSVLLHGMFFATIVLSPILFPSSKLNWGSEKAGDGIKVNIVGSMAGIALPAPPVVDAKGVASDSKGLYQPPPPTPAPAPAPPPPVTKAEPVPDTKAPVKAAPPVPKAAPVPDTKAPPKVQPAAKPAPPAPTKPSKTVPTPQPDNAVPFGQGPKPDLAYGQIQTGNGAIGAQVGDGAFGVQFGAYVQTMQRQISGHWLQGVIDPGITHAPRVSFTFDIQRDGTITNIALKQSSGFTSVDRSAQRALLASSPLPPLPRDFSGSKVSVNFYFEYTR